MSDFDPQNPYAPSQNDASSPNAAPDAAPDPIAVPRNGGVAELAISSPSVPYRSPTPELSAVPAAPRMPTPRARQIMFGLAGQIGGIIAGGMFFAFGMLFVFIFARNLPDDFALTILGHTTQGTIVSRTVDNSMTVNGHHPTTIRFRYDVDDKVHESESSVTTMPASLKKNGAAVNVEVLGFLPDVARIEETTRNEAGYGPVFTFIFPFAGMALVISTLVSAARRRRAFKFGKAAIGTITYKGGAGGRSSKQSMVVRYTFADSRGQTCKGAFSHPDPMVFADYYVEAPVIVLFDEKNPMINTVYIA